MDRFNQIVSRLRHIFNTCHSQRLEERKDLLAILDTLCRVNKGNLPSITLVCIQDGVIRPSLMNCRNLVGDIVSISYA